MQTDTPPTAVKKWLRYGLLGAAGLALLYHHDRFFTDTVRQAHAQLHAQWKAYIDQAHNDPRWSQWDCEIQSIVHTYNAHLADTPGYRPLDWHMVKALAWVETGAGSPAWSRKPLQIGVAHDPGLHALLSPHEGGPLILPPGYRRTLTATSIRNNPVDNLRAGIGYLLLRMAELGHTNQVPPDSPVRTVTVQKGENFSSLAKKYGSTVSHLQALNPHVHLLHPGQTLRVQTSRIVQTITGWRPLTTTLLHARYNGFGDSNYAHKLDYVLPLIAQAPTTPCPPSPP